ncbi:MAG: HD domain-containing protein [Treponema sp.]|nr:HD domain-containing protein [Treponema sp.]
MIKTAIHSILKEITGIFNNNGKRLYLVGGAVRDMLRGEKIHDWDLATDAHPDEVTKIIKNAKGKVVPTGIKHGTVTVFYKGHSAEITTFRIESKYSDGRRPDEIQYTSDIEEDLSRRDFTMNAIALRLPEGEIIDPFKGAEDIKAKIIRCAGDPEKRFGEDGLRPLRAVRFAAQLGYEIEEKTLNAISGALSVCEKVSQERVRDEIDKILSSPLPSRAFLLMEKTGLLKLFLGELSACRGIEQKGFHRFDVLDHSLYACDYAAANNFSHELRLAALFHDVGKPKVRKMDSSGVWTFYRHEEVSAEMTRKILNRLRYSNVVIDCVCHLIKEHMFNYTENWSDAAVRRFIARTGEKNLKDLYCLRQADSSAFAGKEPDHHTLTKLADRVEKILLCGRAFTIKDLAVSGKDLMKAGIPSGKTMGIILNQLLETVIDDPEQNTKEKLLEIAGNYFKKIHTAAQRR